jgi:hypothetical protein
MMSSLDLALTWQPPTPIAFRRGGLLGIVCIVAPYNNSIEFTALDRAAQRFQGYGCCPDAVRWS